MSRGPRIGLGPLPLRQRELLDLLAAGLNPREASARMGVGVSTVRSQIQKLLWRYSAGTQVEMLVLAREAGDLP